MHIEIRNPPVCHKLLDFNYGTGSGLVLLNLFITEVNICHRIIWQSEKKNKPDVTLNQHDKLTPNGIQYN